MPVLFWIYWQFVFLFNPDDYINILLTFYDKIVLIACLQIRANIIPCVRDLYPPLEKRWTLGQRYLSCLSQADRCSQRSWTGATDLLPKFTENEVMEAAPIWCIAEVTRSDLKGPTSLIRLPSRIVFPPRYASVQEGSLVICVVESNCHPWLMAINIVIIKLSGDINLFPPLF